MKKPVWKTLIGICLALALMTGMAPIRFAAGDSDISQNPSVLFLGSYNFEWESVPKHLAGVTDTLDDRATIDYVFMDTKRLRYEDVKELVYRDVLSRMEKRPFDYVIAADDAALAFVLEYRDELFMGIPVVFEGINDVEFAYEAAKDPLITGIVELFPLEETISVACRLTPDATQVIGISDDTVSGQGSTKQFLACESSFPNLSFSTINCSELTYDEIGKTVARFGCDTILIYLMMTDDADGNTYSHTEATEYVAACANTPVYKADELGLGDSVLGGVMTSYYDMAADAASIVLALIGGESVSSFPVQTASFYCAFDKAVMNRFGITRAEVSAACDSVVQYVNDDPSYFRMHKGVLIPAFVIVLLSAAFGVLSAIVVHGKKKLVKRLQERERMLNSLLDNIPGGLAIYRIYGTEQDEIDTVYSSQGIPKLSGRTMAEYEDWIRGGLFDNTVAAEDLPHMRAAIHESVAEKLPLFVQYHLKGKDGSLVPVTLTGEWGYDEKDGSRVYYAVYMNDSEQEKARNAEREAIRARAENKAKSEFLSRMSHDIRTPLNAVLGFTALARDEQNIPRAVTDYLDQIELSGKYLLSLVNDVLDLSKIESRKLELHEENVNWQEALDAAAAFFRMQAEKKGIRLITDFSVGETPWIIIDPLRMRQVYMNLLGNAVKFSAEGTEIRWAIKSERTESNMAHMICTISDQGCGMSREFMARMFRPFEQSDPSHSGKGTGLGLPIVNSLVGMMGGTIHVESELGKGSTFTIALVLKLGTPRDQATENALYAPNSRCLDGRRVLLCEDNPINVVLAKRLLEKVGCIIVSAENGRIGLETFAASQRGEYDAILMDIRMPEMDGLHATKAIRAMERPDAKTIPIISMSADAFDQDVQQSIAAGMNAHVSKPVDPKLLYETLERFICPRKDT